MGWVDKGEALVNAATRELFEETGYKTLSSPKKFLNFYADPGRGSEAVFVITLKNSKK